MTVIDRMARATSPSLFDGACDPELLLALVLSHLMSPSLWELGRRIEQRFERDAADPGCSDRLSIMAEIHRYVNAHVFHLSPADVERLHGLVDVAELRERLGPEVDYVMALLDRHFRSFVDRGAFSEKQKSAWESIAADEFPNYEYSTLDLLHAHSRDLEKAKHRPFAVSSCADEAGVIAALAISQRGISLDDVLLLGSPGHYMTFVLRPDGAWWFNGKREYFDAGGWKEYTAGMSRDAIQEAFFDRLVELDRIITFRGCYRFHTRSSTLSPQRLERIFDRLEAFFGVELIKLGQARRQTIRFMETPESETSVEAFRELRDATQAGELIRALAARYPDSLYEAALYAYRARDVCDPDAYLRASLDGRQLHSTAAGVRDVAGAVAISRAIDGCASVLPDPDRVVLPEEVLHFDTGDESDRALLLYALLRVGLGAGVEDVQMAVDGARSRVRFAGEWLTP